MPYHLSINTMLPSINEVMGNIDNNSQLIQLLCTFNICENVEPGCCQDCMVRILCEDTNVFHFWWPDPGKLMWKQMSSSKTGMVPSSVIALLWQPPTRSSKAFQQATFCEIGTPRCQLWQVSDKPDPHIVDIRVRGWEMKDAVTLPVIYAAPTVPPKLLGMTSCHCGVQINKTCTTGRRSC